MQRRCQVDAAARMPRGRRQAGLAVLLLLLPAVAFAAAPDTPSGGCEVPEPTQDLQLTFARLAPFARDVLAHHRVHASIEGRGREARVQIHLRALRELELPEGHPSTTYLPGVDGAAILQDRRSRHPALWRVDTATVSAANRAYDVHDAGPGTSPRLEASEDEEGLEDYRLVRLVTDRYSGFAAMVLESRPGAGPPHRIYAIAGTHVFERTDLRSWASGLTMGRAQYVSNAALRLVRDAADYAGRGGEVFITGQSQGGLVAQGFGVMLQAYLEARGAPHALIHVVSWGASGVRETLARAIAQQRAGGGRGFPGQMERHWAETIPDQAETIPDQAETMAVWDAIASQWAAVAPGQEDAWLTAIASRMRVVGFFFEIDLFARGGSFLGTAFAFPTALVLPQECDMTVAELIIGMQPGAFGVRLESHFLKGYRRAVGRGAIAVARPARPARWEWFSDLMPTLEDVGDLWLEMLHLSRDATTEVHWRGCTASAEWFTTANRYCRASWWPGCGAAPDEERWCLVRRRR
ncbi:hypothetical protein KPL78_21420 [Roseomonas sp. HJA6]|uniref:DUF2974 domain-containing protein n=1 Tax=Roseomonas alba TaxID=2846776 RepID=A0ABS7ADQ4_9PROT|nr:hypothetical protein [Neoroseomonas alba]MBW6400435.1 hypothetical protein [Neoroseomonas alba]